MLLKAKMKSKGGDKTGTEGAVVPQEGEAIETPTEEVAPPTEETPPA